MKGQVELNVSSMDFEHSTSIYRPAGIYGNSNSPNFLLSLAKSDIFGVYKTIDIDVLARAMVNGSLSALQTVPKAPVVYQGAELFAVGEETV